jgi:hypothetical protein
MRTIRVAMDGRSAKIPEMWLVGACHSRRDMPYQTAMAEAIRRWFEQEDMERAYLAQHDEGAAS